jgi:transcriptional regulator with XRE-family HTH domain
MGKRAPSAVKKTFGSRLRALRKAASMSQLELGERSGLDYTYVGGIERGERNPTLEVISKLADGLQIEVEQMFRFGGAQARDNRAIADLVALLENEEPALASCALELVRSVASYSETQ